MVHRSINIKPQQDIDITSEYTAADLQHSSAQGLSNAA
jgi:hypothetical protein